MSTTSERASVRVQSPWSGTELQIEDNAGYHQEKSLRTRLEEGASRVRGVCRGMSSKASSGGAAMRERCI